MLTQKHQEVYDNNNNILDFPANNNNSILFKCNSK